MKISSILDSIDIKAIALPEFQRGYVWNRDQVKGLMQSLYRGYPVGSLLVWLTPTENAPARGGVQLNPGYVKLLLDGQQRITSLYGIIRGKAPQFFDGNAQAFTGIYFNMDDETFEFYAPMKMDGNPLWIEVTALMKQSAWVFINNLMNTKPEIIDKVAVYGTRLNRLAQIKDIELYIEDVTGEDKTVDVVVDIFNRVNSGGTKLSKGDLALARICAGWPEARQTMKAKLQKYRSHGYQFELDWLLRCLTATVTGQGMFSGLKDVKMSEFQLGLTETERVLDTVLEMIASRLGLDYNDVLGSRGSIPLLARYVALRGGKLSDHRERDRLLFWYVHTLMWGRYAGSTESVLNQDLNLLQQNAAPDQLESLITLLRQNRGDLKVQAQDFAGWSVGARFYPILYMMTRVCRSLDFFSGHELSGHLLGSHNRLQVHHVFPKALLYRHNYRRDEANAIANFTFLTQETNISISDRAPMDYFGEVERKQPGALESHWIPKDPELWKVENYRDFLSERRRLLANALNNFLEILLLGTDTAFTVISQMAKTTETTVEPIETEEQLLADCVQWVSDQGLAQGILNYELADEDTGEVQAILDIAWPEGLQQGIGESVAVLLEQDAKVAEAVNRKGYRFFTSIDALKAYVQSRVLRQEVVSDHPMAAT